MFYSCQSEPSEVGSSQVEVKEEDKKPQKNPLLEERPILSSDKEITWTNEEAVAEETPWKRRFELQVLSGLDKRKGRTDSAEKRTKELEALNELLNNKNLNPFNLGSKTVMVKEFLRKGIKNHYSDRDKKTLAKQEFFYNTRTFLILVEGKVTNKTAYHISKNKKENEKIYLKNGQVKEEVKILKSVWMSKKHWAIKSVSYL